MIKNKDASPSWLNSKNRISGKASSNITVPQKTQSVKSGADGDIIDISENMKYHHSSKDTKKHKHTDYFDYFVKTVQIDGKVFDIHAIVKKQYNVRGGYAYSIVLMGNKKTKASPPSTVTSTAVKIGGNASIDPTIPQDKSVVNSSISKNSENDTTSFTSMRESIEKRMKAKGFNVTYDPNEANSFYEHKKLCFVADLKREPNQSKHKKSTQLVYDYRAPIARSGSNQIECF